MKFKSFIFIVACLVVLISWIGVTKGSTSETDSNLSNKQPDKFVGLNFQNSGVDPSEGILWQTVSPRLHELAGKPLQNGSLSKLNLEFSLDVYFGPSSIIATNGNIVGGLTVPVRMNGSVDSYPFDTYSASMFNSVVNRVGFTEEQLISPLDLTATNSVITGYQIVAKQVPYSTQKSNNVSGNMDEGIGYIEWKVERSPSAKLIAVLLGLLMIIGLIVSSLITFAILKGNRPPSINALAWLAAFLFALFSIRSEMPGSPPSGVFFDRWVFYPVILGLVLLIGLNVLSWVSRPDWDLENNTQPKLVNEQLKLNLFRKKQH